MHNQINQELLNKYQNRPIWVTEMKNEESFEILMDKLKHRFAKAFLDLLILQMVKAKPTWGYDIIKKTETTYKLKLRHGALYPMLNKLKAKGLIKCRRELQKGRVRKIYEITTDGRKFLKAYHDFLKEQTNSENIKEHKNTKKDVKKEYDEERPQ